MAEEYTREWKYRAWHPTENKMYSPEDLEEPETQEDAPKTIYGQLIDGNLKIADIKTNPPVELVPMQSTNWFDNEQFEVYEGDILEIDNAIYQVIWDDDTAGYLLLGENGDVFPGGAYLGDAMKIVGNIFENGDADPEERRRMLKFRAWDPDAKIMYMPEDIKDPQSDMTISLYAYLSFGALYIYDLKNDPPTPMQSTGWLEAKDSEIYEGDILAIGEYDEIAQVIWSDEVGQFMLMANDGTLSPGDSSIISQTEKKGNIYQDPAMVPQF